MCCCDQPTINGQLGYKWQPNDTPSIRRPYPPELSEGDELIIDEPGRCGGVDAHCHHYRVVLNHGMASLLVQHGGGKESIRLSGKKNLLSILASLDTHARYWLLHTIYYAHHDGKQEATDKTNGYWMAAAAGKRIRTRKRRGTDRVKVWVEPLIVQSV